MKKIIAEDKWGWPVESKALSEAHWTDDERVTEQTIEYYDNFAEGVKKLPKFFDAEVKYAKSRLDAMVEFLDKAAPLVRDVMVLADIRYGAGKDSAGPDIFSQRLKPNHKNLLNLLMEAASKDLDWLDESLVAVLTASSPDLAKDAEGLVSALERIKQELTLDREEGEEA